MTSQKKRAFVSFDFDNDKDIKDAFIGQARTNRAPFDVADHSLKEAQPERDWQAKAKAAITRSEIFIVLLGSRTRAAPGVLKEIKMARDLGKTCVQIIGRQNGTKDWAVPNAGRVYSWNWDNLRKLLA